MNHEQPATRAPGPRPSGAVTIKQVAAVAGVSIATVSRVVAGLGGVRKQVRDRVLAAVGQLDYQPNRLARDLRAGLRKVVGVIVPDLQNPFFPAVVHGVEEVLSAAGYTLILAHSGGIQQRETSQMAVLRGEGAAGLILVPDDRSDASYRALGTWELPVVAVDRAPKGLQVDLVSTSNREGVCEAVTHLLSHGYRDIAFINGPEGLSVTRERLGGFLEALKRAGVNCRNACIIHSDFRQEGGRAAMNRLLDLSKPPRAVVSANNLMTLGVLQAIHGRGVDIPSQVALIGFDDMPWATSLRPPLTVVMQPAEDLGRTAAQLLLERLKDPKRLVRQVILPTRLVVRESCGLHSTARAEAGRELSARARTSPRKPHPE
jgi:DNA-binding LacI/PurR family transcriptional regulator